MKKNCTYRIEVETKYGLCYLKKEYTRTCDVIRAMRTIDFFGRFGYCTATVCIFNEDRLIGRSEPLCFTGDMTLNEFNRVA